MTGSSPDSLSLSWTVPQGHFDSFTVQYKNGDGQPKAVRVPGHEDQVTISGLEPDHKYKMNLYGFHDGQRVGPVSVIGVTSEWSLEAPEWGLMGGSASLRWWVTGVQEAPLLEAEPCCPLCPPAPVPGLPETGGSSRVENGLWEPCWWLPWSPQLSPEALGVSVSCQLTRTTRAQGRAPLN